MTATEERNALFISHANPEQNDFVLWLGAKLEASGFAVWADVLNLRGGRDWSRELEGALESRSRKMLLVCSPLSMDRQGVRNEVEIAASVARSIGDTSFIIPLRLEPFKPHFRIAQAQYVDFSESWANGLSELNQLLEEYAIPRKSCGDASRWLSSFARGQNCLVQRPERLISNWLAIDRCPSKVAYYRPLDTEPLTAFQNRRRHRWPVVPFQSGVLAFMGEEPLPASDSQVRIEANIGVDEFLRAGWKEFGISRFDATRFFSDLANRAVEEFLVNRGLTAYQTGTGRVTWWPRIGVAPLSQVTFSWPRLHGRRRVCGVSDKRRIHWHYGIRVAVSTMPVRHLRLDARLIFSENGLDPIPSTSRMHSLRRSFAKSWRNARWRDMMLAFLWWLGNGKENLVFPAGNAAELVLSLPPIAVSSTFSVPGTPEAPGDVDDPELDDWGDKDGELAEESWDQE